MAERAEVYAEWTIERTWKTNSSSFILVSLFELAFVIFLKNLINKFASKLEMPKTSSFFEREQADNLF